MYLYCQGSSGISTSTMLCEFCKQPVGGGCMQCRGIYYCTRACLLKHANEHVCTPPPALPLLHTLDGVPCFVGDIVRIHLAPLRGRIDRRPTEEIRFMNGICVDTYLVQCVTERLPNGGAGPRQEACSVRDLRENDWVELKRWCFHGALMDDKMGASIKDLRTYITQPLAPFEIQHVDLVQPVYSYSGASV